MTALVRGRYEPLDVVGRGGQGEVVRARDRMHDRLVALKVRYCPQSADREAILGEARILLGLRPHPNLPLVREDFFEDDRYVVVMDWIEGGDLRAALAERGPLPLDEVLGILDQVASALDHLHAHTPPIVHKDVKPANVIVTPDGRAVLVDFGISAPTGAGATTSGTPGYLAPEIASGGRPEAAADVFGLAATAYALLTGEPPRAGHRPKWKGIPKERAALVALAMERALAFDPARRPESAGALVASMRSGPEIPNNLPVELTAFIGREQEVDEVSKLLGAARLVTLTGAGGMGKTRLALRVAGAALEAHPDGVWVGELAALSDPGLLAQTVAGVVGVREESGVDLAHSLGDRLVTKRALLVLDNCEHLVGAVAELAESLLGTCPVLRILATSREPLGVAGETVWRVPPLELPEPSAATPEEVARSEAVRLFVDRARHVRSGFDPSPEDAAAVAQVCRRLEGIPLAIELAAARMRSLSVHEIAERLDDRFRLLTGGRRTALPRQRTLRAAVDWSYELLDERERGLLRRLAVFSGGVTLAAAEEVCSGGGIPREDVLDLVTQIVDKSLALFEEEDEPRYELLETIREYAEERLLESGEMEPVRARHRDTFLALAEEAAPGLQGPEQQQWLDRLEREHDNLRLALAWSCAQGEADPALRLALGLWRFWEVRGYLSEGRRWFASALAAGEPQAELRAGSLRVAGVLAQQQGDYEAAEQFYQQSLDAARELGHEQGVANSLHDLGSVAYARGEHRAARALYDEALEIRRTLGDRTGVADSLTNLGALAVLEGDYEEAERLFGECLAIYRESGDQTGVADCLSNLGVIAGDRGDTAQARAHHEESLSIRRELGDRWGIAASLMNLAGLARDRGDTLDARGMFEEALLIERDLGATDAIAYSLHGLGTVAQLEGDVRQAQMYLTEALTLRVELGDGRGIAECLEGLASVAAESEPRRAVVLIAAADGIRRSTGTPLPPADLIRREESLEIARAALGDGFDEAWSSGEAMAAAEAIEFGHGRPP